MKPIEQGDTHSRKPLATAATFLPPSAISELGQMRQTRALPFDGDTSGAEKRAPSPQGRGRGEGEGTFQNPNGLTLVCGLTPLLSFFARKSTALRSPTEKPAFWISAI